MFKKSLVVQPLLLLVVSLTAFADQTAAPKRVPLPDIAKLNLDCDIRPLQNRKALICFWAYSQRPSRRFVKELVAQHDQLAQLNVSVLLIQTDPQSRDQSKAWLDLHQIDWPCGTLTGKVDAHLRDWSVSALPWPILSDVDQIRSMGFSIGQLSEALAAKDLTALPLHTNWWLTFDAIYRLQDGEILKRIAPPFDPSRRKYFQSISPNGRRVPDVLVFRDNTLRSPTELYGNKGSLYTTLRLVIELKNFEYDIRDELLATKLRGDWIIREKMPVGQKLSALEPILSKVLRRPVLFKLRKVEREAVIVNGTFNMKPLNEEARRPQVYLYTDPNDDRKRGGGGGVDSLAELIRVIGNTIQMPMVDKTAPCENLDLGYSTLRSSSLRSLTNPVEKRNRIKTLLDNVSKQTGLTFEFKRHKVDVWFLVDKQCCTER